MDEGKEDCWNSLSSSSVKLPRMKEAVQLSGHRGLAPTLFGCILDNGLNVSFLVCDMGRNMMPTPGSAGKTS